MDIDKTKKWLQANSFSVIIVLSSVFGFLSGLLAKPFALDPITITYIGLPGQLLVRAFSLLIVPLIICSLASSVSTTKQKENQKLVWMTFVLFIGLSLYTSLFGLTIVGITKVGVRTNVIKTQKESQKNLLVNDISKEDAIVDLIKNLVPDNLLTSTFTVEYTARELINPANASFGYQKLTKRLFVPNMLGLCVISLALGFALAKSGEATTTLKTLLEETNFLVMEILMRMLKLMAFGMFCWMFETAIKMKSPEAFLGHLIWFYIISFVCLVFHVFIFLPAIYFLVIRKDPFRFHFNLTPVMMFAFGSCSSAMTLPFTIKYCEEANKISPAVTRFVLPLGMNLHMNGSCFYYSVVALFIAQMQSVDCGIQQIVSLTIYCLFLSMAAPGTPSSGGSIVNFIASCKIIGIEDPMEILPYIFTLDWFMSRVRTVANVIGDCYVAAIVEKFCSKNSHQDFELEIKN